MSPRDAAPAGAFDLLCVGRICFGRGRMTQVGELAAGLGETVLVVTNAGEPGDGGVVDGVGEVLSAAVARCFFVTQPGEPTVADVERALETARAESCDVVIGLGGGSAIDVAKATAGLLTNGGSPLDYMEVVGSGRRITRRAAPWIAVPTTAGTGAEVTKNAVIASPENHFKASIRGEELLARAVVVDPQLGVDVPPAVTASAGMDALCQLIESYTSVHAQPVTDALAAVGISRAARSLRRAFADGSDLDAREDMALAALLSGITLTNAGLGAVHGFAAPLGGNFPVPHGVVCAALLGGVMSANVAALRAESPEQPVLGRYADVGRMLTGRDDLPDGEAVDAGIEFVGELAEDLTIPPLREFGLTDAEVPRLVSLARKSSSMRYNPVTLSEEALGDILAQAI